MEGRRRRKGREGMRPREKGMDLNKKIWFRPLAYITMAGIRSVFSFCKP